MFPTSFSESRYDFRKDIFCRSDCGHSSELVTELCGEVICLTENSSNTRTKIELKKCWFFPVLFIWSAVSGTVSVRVHNESTEVTMENNTSFIMTISSQRQLVLVLKHCIFIILIQNLSCYTIYSNYNSLPSDCLSEKNILDPCLVVVHCFS